MFQSTNVAQPTLAEMPSATENDPRESVRHILIGSPPVVKNTKAQLHQAGYAEVLRWTHPISIPSGQLIITPSPGEVMSLLVKLIRLG
ncbi:MAG: hypothetical protein F6K04_22295 [Leptolyngbya sp. SIO4C5]|nr:hypothetical protein [Leptolyngbya sp. SIO4C5]